MPINFSFPISLPLKELKGDQKTPTEISIHNSPLGKETKYVMMKMPYVIKPTSVITKFNELVTSRQGFMIVENRQTLG